MTKRIFVVSDDGLTENDITEKVQILYDLAHQSMDWGSGMLDNEEMEKVVDFAVLMGWEVPPLPDSGPMVTVAQKYPDHYEIKQTVYPEARRECPQHPEGHVVREEYTRSYVEVKR